MTHDQQRIVAELSTLISDALVMEKTGLDQSNDGRPDNGAGGSAIGHVALGMADVLATSMQGFDPQAFLTDCTQGNAERVVGRSGRRLAASGQSR